MCIIYIKKNHVSNKTVSEGSQIHQPPQVPVWFAHHAPKYKVTETIINKKNNNRFLKLKKKKKTINSIFKKKKIY